MARRVNTKFVVILSSAVVGAVGIYGGIKINNWRLQQDPEVVKARAKAAEDRADQETANPAKRLEDLKLAVANTLRAATLLSVKHRPDADVLFVHGGDLCMKVSKEGQTQEDVVVYYQNAMANYRRALLENPLNKAVNELLLEEDYQNARSSLQTWQAVEDTASRLIKNQDGVKPRIYRAEARLGMLDATSKAPAPEALADIDADLKAALAFDPHAGKAVALRARLMWLQANRSAEGRGLTKPAEIKTDAKYQSDVAAVRRMLTRGLENQWGEERTAPGWDWFTRIPRSGVNADMAAMLANLSGSEYQLSGGTDAAKLDNAIALLEAAFASGPDNSNLADQLGGCYLTARQPEKAEELFKRIIAGAPNKPLGYLRLAIYYRNSGDYVHAIASYQDLTAHQSNGSGRDAILNSFYLREALDGIAWLNLELAERPGVTPEQFKAYMRDAADATDKLRAKNAPKGMIDLLDGRAQLINRDIPHAVATLRLAEANLNGIPQLIERYRQTELQLARANEMQSQLGAALEWVNKALEIQPGDLNVLMRKGSLLVQLGRYEEVRLLMLKYLGDPVKADGQPTGTFANEGGLPPAFVDNAKRYVMLAENALHPDPNARVALRDLGANLQVAAMEFDAEEWADAAQDAALVLEKSAANGEAVNSRAYFIAISSNMQLAADAKARADRPDSPPEVKRTSLEEQHRCYEEAKKLAALAVAALPGNATFQVVKAQLDLPEGTALTLDSQKTIIQSITDPYVRTLSLAGLYHRNRLWDEEIKVLQQAREPLKSATSPNDREKANSLLDQLFLAAMTAAQTAPEAPKREEYWKLAQMLVAEIEKLNLDGTDGKIYRGRLEFARTDGKSGLQYLQQAVAQRPDYALAHQYLGQAYHTLAILNAGKGAAISAANANLALEEYRQVIRLAPDNIAALQNAIKLLVDKGDSASRKEAQGLLVSGLAIAPRNSILIDYKEILANVEDAIASRLELLRSRPEDRNNLRRLVGLWVRLSDEQRGTAVELAQKPETMDRAPDAMKAAQDAMDKAIVLAESDFKAHPDDLGAGDLLARLLVKLDKTDKGAARALQIYAQFVASADPLVKFNALITRAEFLRNAVLNPEVPKNLKDQKLVAKDDLREEAADALQDAIKLEPSVKLDPDDQDVAERRLADMYFDLGNMAGAEKMYLQVLAKTKNADTTDRVTRRVIETQMRQGKYAEARARLAELLKKQPQDIEGLLLRANLNLEQGIKQPQEDPSKALQNVLSDLNLVLTLDDVNVNALYYRAMAQMTLGDRLDDAEKDLLLAARKDPSDTKGRLLLAQLYQRTQRYEEASRQYREIITLHPDQLQVRVEYTNLLKSLADLQATLPKDSDLEFVQALRRLSPLDKLLDEVREASSLFPSAHWVYLYAQGLAMQGKDAEALSYYQRLYDNAASDPQVCDAYFGALLKNKDFAKVVELSSALLNNQANAEFIQKNPEYVTLYLKRAAAYQALNKPDEAVKDIDLGFGVGVAAVTKSGNYSPFISVLNEASSSILSPELVAQRLRVRVAADPSEDISKIGLIQALLVLDQPDEALTIVDAMKPPNNNEGMRLLILRQAALVHGQAKQYDKAEKDYVELEKIAPDNVDNLNNYAFLLADGMKRPKEAIPYAVRALKILSTRSDPGQLSSSAANVYDTLGWAYYLADDNNNAIANLQKSIKVQPQAAAYLHLSTAYLKANDLVAAQQKYLEGVKLAAAKHDAETLVALDALKPKLNLP